MFRLKRSGFGVPPHLAMLMSFAATSGLNYIFGIVTGWLLLPGDYGLVGFAQTIILICGLILNSGLAWSLSAELAATGERERWASLIRGSIILNLGAGLVMALLIIVFFQVGILHSGLETWQVTLAVAGSLPFLSIIAIVSGTLRGIQAFSSLASILALEVVFKTACGIVLVKLGYGPAGALAGFAAGGLIAAICGLWRVQQLTGMTMRGTLIFLPFQRTVDMFGALIGMALLLNLDIIFVKIASAGERDIAGFYQSATMLANLPYYLANSIFNVMFSQIVRQKTAAQHVSIMGSNLRSIVLFFIPVDIGLMIAPEQVLGLVFPHSYLVAAPILRILAIGNLMLILTGFLSTVLQASGRAFIPAVVFGVVIVLEFFALLVVVPHLNMTGAALVFATASTLSLIAQFLVVQRLIQDIHWFAVLHWLRRYLVCLTMAIAVYLLWMAVAGMFLPGAGIAGVVYAGSLVAMDMLPVPAFLQKFFLRTEPQG